MRSSNRGKWSESGKDPVAPNADLFSQDFAVHYLAVTSRLLPADWPLLFRGPAIRTIIPIFPESAPQVSLPMPGEFARAVKPAAARLLSPAAAFSRYGEELARLLRGADPLTAMTFSPAWWEAVPPPRGYVHRLLVLQRDGEVKAALRFRERTVCGIPVGVLHGNDGKGENLVLCQPGAEEECLAEGLQALFGWRRCLALLICRADEEATEFGSAVAGLRGAGARGKRLEARTLAAAAQWRTELRGSIDQTVERFGHRTRRNLRHALRRIAQNGWEFLPELTPEQVAAATVTLARRSTHPYTAKAGRARLELEQAGGFSMGIRDSAGRWLSLLSGVRREEGTTDVFWQSNVAHGRDSVGFIMRAALMQHEGMLGTRQLRWIGGTSPLMEHCCLTEAGSETLITRPGLRLTLLRRLLHTRLATEANPMKRLLRLEQSDA